MFWGRKKTHRVSKERHDLFQREKDKFLLSLEDVAQRLSSYDKVFLDIGCGRGELSMKLVESFPEAHIIACDLFYDGLTFLVKNASLNDVQNLSIAYQDVMDLLESISKETIDHVFVWFPDPWPKRRHNKRRLFMQRPFLENLSRVLKTQGVLTWRTDIEEYFEVGNTSISRFFEETAFDIPECITSYHAKALKAGHLVQDQSFRKRLKGEI